ncbi:chloride channel protein [soil metagenome]
MRLVARTLIFKLFKLHWLRGSIWKHALLLSVPVGVIAGLGGIVFNSALDRTSDLVMVRGADYVMPRPGSEGGAEAAHLPGRPWLLIIIPAVGGLLSGLLVYSLAPEAEGHGTDAVVESFHHKRGIVRARVPIIKTVSSILTIASGGSAGREGPIGQIGAGFGSALATVLKTSDRERRLLMLAGAGAGIGAVFRAPLGGALFVTEVLYRDMEFESAGLVIAFVASIIAYSIYCGFTGVWGPIFNVPALQFNHPLELPLYAILGCVCAAAGVLYVKSFYGIRDYIFKPLPIPNHFKPAIGGLAVGAIGFFHPEALGMGYGWTQMAIDGTFPVRLAVSLVLVKMVTTGLTISSGGSGGVFAPSIVIGGCLGAAVSAAVHRFLPGVEIQPAAFVLMGMAGFFAGVAKAPISSLVMVSEMTMGYGLLVPLMTTTAVAYLLTPKSISIYEKQVMSRVDSPAHEGEFVIDVLEGMKVRDVVNLNTAPAMFHGNTALADIFPAVVRGRQQVFPIINDDGTLKAVLDVDDIRLFLTEHGVPAALLVADDLRATDYRVVTLDEDLASALRKLQAVQLEELPVIESDESKKVVGILGRRDIIAAYHGQMYAGPELNKI